MYKNFEKGRSMIEMLGVLAIIAVLSVGGIAGYSKAMLMWKANVQKNMLAQMIANMIKIKPSLNKNAKSLDNITYLFNDMGDLPEGTVYENNSIYDKDGNIIQAQYGLQTMYQNGQETKSFIYVLQFWFMSNGKSLSPSAETYCRNLVEVSKSVADEINFILLVQSDSESEISQSASILFSQNDLKKATLSDIHKKCKISFKEGGSSRFTLYLTPY